MGAIWLGGPLLAKGSWMRLVLRLIETRTDRETGSIDVLEFSRPSNLRNIASSRLMLSEAKQLLARVQ